MVYIVYGRADWPDAIDLDTDGGPVEGVTRIIGAEPVLSVILCKIMRNHRLVERTVTFQVDSNTAI